jgi:uncharacterized repeat protein (TIGR01451 family)
LLPRFWVAGPPEAPPTTASCGYGTGGTNAGNVCWLDMSGYNAVEAQSAGGQQMQITLPGGDIVSFTVSDSPVANPADPPNNYSLGNVAAHQFPTYSGAWLGNGGNPAHAYVGTPGKPALYQTDQGGVDNLTLSNISVVDPEDVAVTGYSFLMADAEATGNLESIDFSSDVNLNEATEADDSPLCAGGTGAPVGLGTPNVTCVGGPSSQSNGLVLLAQSPTSVTAILHGSGLEAAAFAVETTNITVNTSATALSNTTDSFLPGLTDSSGTSLSGSATASSGGGVAGTDGTTGDLDTITNAAGGDFTLSEAAATGSGTDLSDYSQSWSCTNANTLSTTALPSGSGTSQTIDAQPGDDITCTVSNTPIVDLAVTDTAPALYGPGQALSYTVTVSNNGPANAAGASVADPLPAALEGDGFTWTCTATGGSSCGTGAGAGDLSDTPTVASGGTVTYTVTGTVPAATSGTLTNTATVTPPTGTTDTNCSTTCSDAGSDVVLAEPTVAQSFVTSTIASGGTTQETFTITNPNGTTLSGLSLADSLPAGLSIVDATTSSTGCGSPSLSLASGDTSVAASGISLAAGGTCTITVDVTGTAGATYSDSSASVTGSASATQPAVASAAVTTPATVTVAVPSVSLDLSTTTAGFNGPNQTISYSYAVKNTGNVALTGVGINTGAFSGTGTAPTVSCLATSLAAGASTTCTATYTTTQADVDAGLVTNTATVSGTDSLSTKATSPSSSVTVNATQSPAMTMSETAGPASVDGSGQPVTYSYLVTNTGNVTLSGVAVGSGSFNGNGAALSPSCRSASLAPGASETCTATYTTDQADIEAGGSLTDSTTATATAPGSVPVTSGSESASVPVTQTPSLSVAQTASQPSVTAAGQTITYSYVVTNTGNVSVGSVSVGETSFSGGGTLTPTCPTGSLAPGASVTCTATYTTTQADINAGSITSTATATGTPSSGPAVTSNPSTATVSATQSPGLTVTQTANQTSVSAAGQTIIYSAVVTNTGNVTETGVGIDESSFTGKGAAPALTCPSTTLAPGASETCTGTYTVAAGDIALPAIKSTVTAVGTPPSGTAIASAPATVSVAVGVGSPSLSVKQVTKITSPSGKTMTKGAVGDKVSYSFTLTNTGKTPLTKVGVSDPEVGSVTCANLPAGGLAPGASVKCTASKKLTITGADANAGKLTNSAVASGSDAAGASTPKAHSSSSVKVASNQPRISDTVSAKIAVPGQNVVYTLKVTNLRSRAMKNVTVCDTLAGSIIYLGSEPAAVMRGEQRCWTIKSLPAHGSETFHVTANVSPSGSGEVPNRASATAPGTGKAVTAAASVKVPAQHPVCTSIARDKQHKAGGPPIAWAAC